MLKKVAALNVLVASTLVASVQAQEARRRWEMMCQIRKDKFDYILPQAMRENDIDIWITLMKENNQSLLHRAFCLHAGARMGRKESADPARGRRHRHREGNRVALSGADRILLVK